jgi:hypothetical protein
MASADIALRKAIRDFLLTDAALLALLGGPRVYDAPPRNAPKPCVVFARSRSRDWSAQGAPGREHDLALDVWSAQDGVREALDVAERLRVLLDDARLTLQGFTLVRLEAGELLAARDPALSLSQARLRLRALTETL